MILSRGRLTDDEHVARAMLLGMEEYDRRTNTYLSTKVANEISAVTLEVVSSDYDKNQVVCRMRSYDRWLNYHDVGDVPRFNV